jgi:ribonuclease III
MINNMRLLISSLLRNTKLTKDQSVHLRSLMTVINYRFKTEELLLSAITHTSVIAREGESSAFERMEFLGDSILGLVVAEIVFEKFPDYTEGQLSKFKAKVVSRDFLAAVAKDLALGDYLVLSREADSGGGRENSSILADTMEAIICAIYLDGNIEDARRFINMFLFMDYKKIFDQEDLINYKSRLQEYTQLKNQTLPVYNLIEESGPDHEKVFLIEVEVDDEVVGTGEGHTKKEAQQKAAKIACQNLGL